MYVLQHYYNQLVRKYKQDKKQQNFMLGTQVSLKELLSKGAAVVDVRTPEEFSTGHYEGSVNIPLDIVATHAEELKGMRKPIIAVCRSGARSGAAAAMLSATGVEVYNGGGWMDFENAVK
jgi:rhodanese-related sulfurtransferase